MDLSDHYVSIQDHLWFKKKKINRNYACVVAGNTWEISVPCPQFCCKSKTALKNTVFQKRKEGVLTVGREEGKRQVQRKGSQMRLSLPVMRSQGTIDKTFPQSYL